VTALVNRSLAATAERDNPPTGQFIEIDGVRLHFVDRGAGEPLLLLHGNGSMTQDFGSSGLLDMAASRYRVIAFDRPGYGHSTRPRNTIWSPDAQADLFETALRELGATPAIVFGHSWGASVAMAMALRHAASVQALVLASGYYYPTPRVDAVLASGPAVPILGDVLRYTVTPLLGRALWPALMRKIFGPAEVPAKFAADFPRDLALRPSQLRACAAESALLFPAAWTTSAGYSALRMPVVIVAGAQDRLIATAEQSRRLHEAIGHSTFHAVPGSGHMVHHTAPGAVLAAIDEAAAAAR
jgi:pimeloyl-ACP methyl ester carboxylesterase